jgi:hypothetical protein
MNGSTSREEVALLLNTKLKSKKREYFGRNKKLEKNLNKEILGRMQKQD